MENLRGLSSIPSRTAVAVGSKNPDLSIVIPTHDRQDLLVRCLNSLALQSDPPSVFEVIVVVDGSADSTSEVLDQPRLPYLLRFLSQAHSGPSAARNLGADAAFGRVLLFLDDDMVADPGLVAAHRALHGRCDPVFGLGRVALRSPCRSDAFGRHFARAWQEHYERLDAGFAPRFTDCYGGHLSISRKMFLSLGGFATDLQREEDVEFGFRLQAAGLRMVYVPGATATEDRPLTFGKITRDAERQGAADVQIWRRHAAALPSMKLGSFDCARVREVILRRLLLRVGLPTSWLRVFTPLFARGALGRAWYRFVCTYAYWRGVLGAVGRDDTWNRLTHGTLILMYHAIGNAEEPASRYVVPVRRFMRQLAWIKRRGYSVIDLEAFIAERREHRLPPAGSIVFTLDDGYVDALNLTRPLLAENGFPATFFMVTRLAGEKNTWDRSTPLAGRSLFPWDSARAALRDGIRFAAHTRHHVSLPSLTEERARFEVAGSRDDLLRELGTAPGLFAYPYGHHSSAVRAMIREMGFAAACGVRAGKNCSSTDQFDLRRLLVDGRWGFVRFALAVILGVDLFARRG